MKLQRFIAANIQKAIDKIHNAFGPHALIHSTRSVEDGIEILASEPQEENEIVDDMAQNEVELSAIEKLNSKLQMIDTNLQNLSKYINSRSIYDFHLVDDEQAIKRNLLYYHLNKLGFRGKFCQKFITYYLKNKKLSENINEENIKGALLKHVKFSEKEFIDERNIAVLLGPTGAGKTTTIAKLAKRYITRYGEDSLGLITTDYSDLIGKNQLVYYSKLFNVDLEYVNDKHDLNMVLSYMKKKKLVLIDTHGVSQRDDFIVEPLRNLIESQGGKISSYIVLPCNIQEPILDEIARSFSTTTLKGCILTKQDESISMAPALSVSMNYKMPIAYVCDGQDISEDIDRASPEKMLHHILNESPEMKNVTEENLLKNMNRVMEVVQGANVKLALNSEEYC
jgi:flagellar biosynthesis protein FlhF